MLTALQGLENGEIRIGAKKSRGLGKCKVDSWQGYRFDLSQASGWLEWLNPDYLKIVEKGEKSNKIIDVIKRLSDNQSLNLYQDKRKLIRIKLTLQWENSSILIRSSGIKATDPDAVHLRSAGKDIISGTSLAGVMRARALRIAKLLYNDKNKADGLVNDLFGSPKDSGNEQEKFASRIIISESEICSGKRLVPTRVKIDRFTGGTIDGALFTEGPVYGGKAVIEIELKNPEDHMVGLILLVIKDLITEDLPIGGTSSVGRGFAKGNVKVILPQGKEISWDPEKPCADGQCLEKYVKALNNWKGGKLNGTQPTRS